MSNKLLDKMLNVGKRKVVTLSDSAFFNEKDKIPTDIPIINAALSGHLNGGLVSGLTFLAGPSRHFKSLLGLVLVKAYMKKYPESICIFYDSEFGITPQYIIANDLDPDRIVHVPIEHLEHLKFDIAQRLEQIERGDKIIFFIDSVGNLASKKEAEDALDGKSVADMTRARTMKSLWRIVTPHLTTKDIPCIAVNHTYQEMSLFPKQIMSGGTGGMYSAMQVFIIGKSQEKDGADLAGYNFTINIEKSRFVKEKSKFKFTVKYKGGINKWSGLLDLALESGHCIKPKNGWYQWVDLETGEISKRNYREKETNTKEFWEPILNSPSFNAFVQDKYLVSSSKLVDDETDEDVENIYDSIEDEE